VQEKMEEYYLADSPRQSRPLSFLQLLAAALVGGLIVLSSLPLILPYLLPEQEPVLPWQQEVQEPPDLDLEYQQTAIVAAVNRVSPAVVGITRISQSRDFFGRLTPPQPSGYGSGVIISPEGYIVTNYHVVEGAVEVIVTLSDESELEAEIVGQDQGTDLAVLKIDPQGRSLPWAEMGDSNLLTVGEFVIAIGNPRGLEFSRSVTLGIVSATERSFEVYDWVFGLIQTDAAINPGNSGGPLVNMQGQVVGINSVRLLDTEGLGFSIPSNLVKSVAQSLIANGWVIRPMLGVTISEISPSLAEAYNLASDYGLLVVSTPDGPAKRAGVRPDDIIIEAEGQKITSLRDLRKVISAKSVGDEIKIVVRRGRETLTLNVTLADLNPQ
jgi:serine protease Do